MKIHGATHQWHFWISFPVGYPTTVQSLSRPAGPYDEAFVAVLADVTQAELTTKEHCVRPLHDCDQWECTSREGSVLDLIVDSGPVAVCGIWKHMRLSATDLEWLA